MSSSNYRVRRATVEDLGPLKNLWESLRIPALDLDKRLTEFQVVENAEGKVLGGVGLQIVGRHACLHSEAFADFGHADELRQLLWTRVQSLIQNHGIARLWTREQAPFWKQMGLQPATAETMQRMPANWDKNASGWLTLQLKSDEAVISIDKEFELFVQSEKMSSEQTMDQARKLKMFLLGVTLLISFAFIAAAVYLLLTRKSAGLPAP